MMSACPRTLSLGAATLVVALLLAATCGPDAARQSRPDPVWRAVGAGPAHGTGPVHGAVVGTFDSRAVAVAHTRSRAFAKYLSEQQKDLRSAIARAKLAGDRDMVFDLEQLGPAMQARLHQQGFSTAPVDAILATIEDRLPKIAAAAGVDLIVCKWSLTYHQEGAETVDVTDALVAAFEPDAATTKVIEQLLATEPVPLHEVRHESSPARRR